MCGLKVRFTQSPELRGVFAYSLKVEVVSATDIPSKIFVYHQSPAGIDGNTFAEFDHVATPVDFQEIPEDAASDTVPWYRTDNVVVWFRNVSDLDLAKQMFVDDIHALQKTYDVLTSDENLERQSDIEFVGNGVHEECAPEEEGSIEQDIAAMKTEINKKISKDALDGVSFKTNDAAGIREAVKIMGMALGAKIAKSIALIFGLCSLYAHGAGFSGEHWNQIDWDENPMVVTNVSFDGIASDAAVAGIAQELAQVQTDLANAATAATNYTDSATNALAATKADAERFINLPYSRDLHLAAFSNLVWEVRCDGAVNDPDTGEPYYTNNIAFRMEPWTVDPNFSEIWSYMPTATQLYFSAPDNQDIYDRPLYEYYYDCVGDYFRFSLSPQNPARLDEATNAYFYAAALLANAWNPERGVYLLTPSNTLNAVCDGATETTWFEVWPTFTDGSLPPASHFDAFLPIPSPVVYSNDLATATNDLASTHLRRDGRDYMTGVLHLSEWQAMAHQEPGYMGFYSWTFGSPQPETTILLPLDENGTIALAAPSPTAGNLAALDASGNPVDSQIAASDVVTKDEFAPVANREFLMISSDRSVALAKDAVESAYPIETSHNASSASYACYGFSVNLKSYLEGQMGSGEVSITKARLQSVTMRLRNLTISAKVAVRETGTTEVLALSDPLQLRNSTGGINFTFLFTDNVVLDADKRYDFIVVDASTGDAPSDARMGMVSSPVITGLEILNNNGTRSSHNGAWGGGMTADCIGLASVRIATETDLSGYVPTNRTVAGKALSSDITLTGADIPVSDADATKMDTALGSKLDKSGGTMTGNLTVPSLIAGSQYTGTIYDSGKIWLGGGGYGEIRFPSSGADSVLNIPYLPTGASDTLALLSDIYAAVQQIAPAWVSGTAYAADKLCSYNGVVYQNTSGATIQSAATPDTSGSGWTAKKVSELFLQLAGGEITGSLSLGVGMGTSPHISIGGDSAAAVASFDYQCLTRLITTGQVRLVTIYWPSSDGTLALLSDTMRFSAQVSYAVGDVVFYNGAFYRCTTAHTAGAWDASHFAEVVGGLSTGAPTAPTATAGTSTTQIATTAFVKTEVDSATNAVASALQDDIALKADAVRYTSSGYELAADLHPVYYYTEAAPSEVQIAHETYVDTIGSRLVLFDAANDTPIAYFYTDNLKFWGAALPTTYQVAYFNAPGNTPQTNTFPTLSPVTNAYPVVYSDDLSDDLSDALAAATNYTDTVIASSTLKTGSTSGIRLDNSTASGLVLYFRPRAFGMHAGDKIRSITLHTSSSTSNTSSPVYARLVKYTASSQTYVALSAATQIQTRDVDVEFTFESEPAVDSADQYYRLELTTSASTDPGTSPINASLRVYYDQDGVRKPDCYFLNSLIVPVMSVKYRGTGNPVILNTDNSIGSGNTTYHTGSTLNIQGQFTVLTNGTVTVQSWDQIRLASGQTLPEFIAEAIAATSGNVILNALDYYGQTNSVPVEMVYMDSTCISNAVNDLNCATNAALEAVSSTKLNAATLSLPLENPE